MKILVIIFFNIILILSIPLILTCPQSCQCHNNNVICKHLDLKSVPDNIPKSTVSLDLSFNLIKILNGKVFQNLSNLQNLSLDYNEMKEIHMDAFQGLSDLINLNLSNNDLSCLHTETFSRGLNKLLHLYLGNNEFEKIPPLKAFQMTKLDLSNNRISSAFINESFLLNSGLQTIVLTKNYIKEINDTDFNYLKNTQLKSIMLKMNNLLYIHNKSFSPVKNSLENLELEGNKLLNSTIIESALKGFSGGGTSITYLDLKNCGLTEISADFFKPFSRSKLHHLDLSQNSQLETINENAFDGLNKLQILQLSGCKIVSNKIIFSVLSQLKHLYLDKNRLLECPYRLPGSLESLDLQYNDIRSINKDNFKSLTSLKTLNLNNNEISTIDKDSFLDLYSLIELDLSHNRIKTVEIDIFNQMSSLLSLSLNDQNPCLKKLSATSFFLPNLEQLILSNNCIGRDTDNLYFLDNLPNLVNLSLNNNELRFLNGDIFVKSNKIKNLDLSSNKIVGWSPNTFVPLKLSLVYLQLKVNKISSLSNKSQNQNYFPDFKLLQNVSLNINEWNCTCDNIQWLLKFKSILENPDHIICYFPKEKVDQKVLNQENCSANIVPSQLTYLKTKDDGLGYILWILLILFGIIFAILIYQKREWLKKMYKTIKNRKQNRNTYRPFPVEFSSEQNINFIGEEDENISEETFSNNCLVISPEACSYYSPCFDEIEKTELQNEMVSIDADIVFVTRNIQHKFNNKDNKILIKQINELMCKESRNIVYHCDILVIDYPPPDITTLIEILQIRSSEKKNFLFLSLDQIEEQDFAMEFPYINQSIEYYSPIDILKTFYKIV